MPTHVVHSMKERSLMIRHPSLDENSLDYEGVKIGDGKQNQKRK